MSPVSSDDLDGDRLLPVSNFRVRIGDTWLGCRSVGPIGIEVRDAKRWRGRRRPFATYPPVRIRRALTDSTLLFDWVTAVAAGRTDSRDVLVEQLDNGGASTGLAWVLVDAVPTVWHGPRWDALTSAVAEEVVELRCRTVRRANAPA